jgi:hypothetical protein
VGGRVGEINNQRRDEATEARSEGVKSYESGRLTKPALRRRCNRAQEGHRLVTYILYINILYTYMCVCMRV